MKESVVDRLDREARECCGKGGKDIKYLLIPGAVTSSTDGDSHYIAATQLASLYRVDRSTCATYPVHVFGHDRNEIQTRITMSTTYAGLVPLWPDSTGRYSLPTEIL